MIELSRSSKDELFSRTRTKPEQSSGSNQIIVGGSNHIIVGGGNHIIVGGSNHNIVGGGSTPTGG